MSSRSQGWSEGTNLSIFANQIIKFVVGGGGLMFAMYLGVQITDPNVNGLAASLQYVAAGAFVCSMLAPKRGIYLVLLLSPILDLLKRTLVIFSSVDMLDVATVLSIAPIGISGALLGTFGSRVIFGKKMLDKREKPLFYILLAANTFVIIGILRSGETGLHMLQAIAEICSFLSMIFLVGVHFPTQEDVARFFRLMLVLFVPVALYGFWQTYFGLSDFELRYLASGLTIMQEDYATSSRVFSTLNSNHSYSVTMACCAVISLLQRYMPAANSGQRRIKSFGVLMFLLFSVATVLSLRRTGWLVIVFALGGFFCFQSRIRTWLFYGFSIGGLVLIMLNVGYILPNLPNWEIALQAFTGIDSNGLGLQTFNERLYSFDSLLNNQEIWSWFGLPAKTIEGLAVHDALSQALTSYGVVGLVGFGVVITISLTISHQLIWRVRDADMRKFTALLVAIIFSNLFVGVLLQSHITIFPINFIFWFCVGALLKISLSDQSIALDPEGDTKLHRIRTMRRALASQLNPSPIR